MNTAPHFAPLLVAVLLALAPARSQAADPPPPAAPPPGWRLHDPLVLEQGDLNVDEAGNSLEAMDAAWLAGKPVVSMWRQNTRELVLWREDRPGVWVRWAVLTGLSRNSHLAVLNDALYVAGRISGRSERTDAGTIHVWRLNTAGEVVASQQIAPRSERGQLGVTHLGVHGKSLILWLTQPAQTGRELAASVSHDGGQTWRPLFDKPILADVSAMPEVDERLPVVSLADKQLLGLFVTQQEAGAGRSAQAWLRSSDAGVNWQQRPAALQDDCAAGDPRRVVAVAPDEGSLTAVYLAGREQEQTGQLFFTRSTDGGQTWSRGLPLAPKKPWQPLRTRLLPAGQLLALSWREMQEDGTVGRLSVSHDRGQSWQHLPLADFYRGPVASTWALAAAPTGERLIVGAVVNMPGEAGGRTYFTLQEYSPRSSARTSSNQARIARRIAELGADTYDARQHASRELEALGREAKEPLLEAYRTSTDPEVRQRLKTLLTKMFPPCLQIR